MTTSMSRFPTGGESKRKAMGLAGEWSPRHKEPGEAPPPTISIWRQPVYKAPTMATPRPGADDHLNIRSKGV
jgi:hypothetical protein